MLAPMLRRLRRSTLFVAVVLGLACGAAQAADPAFQRAEQLYAARDLDAARVAFTQLAATGAPRCDYYLGKIAIRQKDYSLAVERLSCAVEQAPRDSDTWHWLGNAHAWVAATADSLPQQAKHARLGLTAYLKAITLDPESVPARLSLINLQRHLPAWYGGGLRRARAQAEEVARRDPVRGEYARALLLAHEKKYAEALRVLAPLRAAQPDYYSAHLLLGYIATRSGLERDAARDALARCLALTPGEFEEPHDTARELLALLDRPPAEAAQLLAKKDEQVTAR